jgi:hypothetical protein
VSFLAKSASRDQHDDPEVSLAAAIVRSIPGVADAPEDRPSDLDLLRDEAKGAKRGGGAPTPSTRGAAPTKPAPIRQRIKGFGFARDLGSCPAASSTP